MFARRFRPSAVRVEVGRLQELAWALRSEGRYKDARARALECLALAQALDAITRAAVLCTVARAHVDLGQSDRAAAYYQQALDQLGVGDGAAKNHDCGCEH